MKSLLQEGSCVSVAIEKAWTNAGKPVEFTIKILAEGKKSFLGLSVKSPAIISLMYDPKKQTAPLLEKQRRAPARQEQQRPRQNQKPQRRSYSAKATKDGQQPQQLQNRKQQSTPTQQQQPRRRELWTPNFITLITTWLKDATHLMGIKIPFTTKVERRTLLITFEKPLMEYENDEKMLLSSFAILFLHALQKQQKRKLPEHRIMITSKRKNSGHQK